jgi:hypothetical protein
MGKMLVQKMWKLLGSKTRHVDQLEDWMDKAWGCWQASEFTWDEFQKIVLWALTENKHTVENLRLARDPGSSLFERQWEMVTLHYDAAMAGKRVMERRSWRYGACRWCDERESTSTNGGCRQCVELYNFHVSPVVVAAREQKLIARHRDPNTKQWFVYEASDGKSLIATGVYENDGVYAISNTIMDIMMVNPEGFAKLQAVVYVNIASARGMIYIDDSDKRWWLYESDDNSPIIAEGSYGFSDMDAVKHHMMSSPEDFAKLRAVVGIIQ